MKNKTKEFRQHIADTFIKSLKEKPIEWKKEWQGISIVPINGTTDRKYTGLNRFWLQHEMVQKGWTDPRFYTFKQVSDVGLKVMGGSKATKVEFWSFYDTKDKRKLTYEEAFKMRQEGEEVSMLAKYYSVFNADQIEGLPPYEEKKLSEAKQTEAIKLISERMKVPIIHDGGDMAFYKPLADEVHLPLPEVFFNQEAYNATALHELAHATGAKHRLNRQQEGSFGSESYAKEELVAEIASCFSAADLGLDGNSIQFDNHTAYIQSWVSHIKEKPEALMAAIKEADKAADYLINSLEFKQEENRLQEKEYEEELEM